MSTLVITKQTGNFFSLVVDSGEPIISEQNRLTTVGELCNFKTANGANLVLKQNILREDITIIENNNPVVPSSVQELWTILIGIGFFDGVAVTAGGGSGTDRFKDLLDTFNYIGRSGQIVTVNDSETGLTTIAYALFSPEDRLKFDSIEFGAQKNVIPDLTVTDPNDPRYVAGKPNPTSSDQQILDGFIGVTEGFDVSQQTFELPVGAICLDVYLSHQRQYKETPTNTSLPTLWSQTNNIVTIKKIPVLNNYLQITYKTTL